MKAQLESVDDMMADLFSEGGVSPTQNREPAPQIRKEESEESSSEETQTEETKDSKEESSPEKVQADSETKETKSETNGKTDEVPSFLKVLRLDKVPDNKEDFEKVLKAAAKSVHDNRTNWDKEHLNLLEAQKLLDLSKAEKAELEKAIEEGKTKLQEVDESKKKLSDDEFLAKYRTRFEDDPEAAMQEMLVAVRREAQEAVSNDDRISELVGQKVLEYQEKACMSEHADYKEVMDVFGPVMRADEKLQDKWADAGGTPEIAYKMAKEYQSAQEYLKDPEAFKQRIIEENEKLKVGGGVRGKKDLTLSGASGARVKNTDGKPGELSSVSQVMDSLFPNL